MSSGVYRLNIHQCQHGDPDCRRYEPQSLDEKHGEEWAEERGVKALCLCLFVLLESLCYGTILCTQSIVQLTSLKNVTLVFIVTCHTVLCILHAPTSTISRSSLF